MAVGGAGIVSGMAPKGYFDNENAEMLIEKAKEFKATPPGRVEIHHDETGFFRYVYEEERGVLDGLKDYMSGIPAYHPKFYRVAEPKASRFLSDDIYRLLPIRPKRVYDFEEVLARLVDASEHMEFRPDYGPEVYTGLVKVDGFLMACIGNRQGYLGDGYPEYGDYPAMGGEALSPGVD